MALIDWILDCTVGVGCFGRRWERFIARRGKSYYNLALVYQRYMVIVKS